jgi:hypothetical protein
VHLLHITPTPSTGTTLVWILFNYVLLWLGSDFQAEEELLGQARVFKVLLVTGMSFCHP